jgi:hypothetical protein
VLRSSWMSYNWSVLLFNSSIAAFSSIHSNSFCSRVSRSWLSNSYICLCKVTDKLWDWLFKSNISYCSLWFYCFICLIWSYCFYKLNFIYFDWLIINVNASEKLFYDSLPTNLKSSFFLPSYLFGSGIAIKHFWMVLKSIYRFRSVYFLNPASFKSRLAYKSFWFLISFLRLY